MNENGVKTETSREARNTVSTPAQLKAFLPDEEATVAFGQCLSQAIQQVGGAVIFLHGNLGMGKTTLTRGVLRGLGHSGAVKSPTYTLVEPYEFPGIQVYHFDLYRLSDPEELEYMGIRDYFAEHSLCLIEWPERGRGLLPEPDLDLRLSLQDGGRNIEVIAGSERGHRLIAALKRKKS